METLPTTKGHDTTLKLIALALDPATNKKFSGPRKWQYRFALGMVLFICLISAALAVMILWEKWQPSSLTDPFTNAVSSFDTFGGGIQLGLSVLLLAQLLAHGGYLHYMRGVFALINACVCGDVPGGASPILRPPTTHTDELVKETVFGSVQTTIITPLTLWSSRFVVPLEKFIVSGVFEVSVFSIGLALSMALLIVRQTLGIFTLFGIDILIFIEFALGEMFIWLCLQALFNRYVAGQTAVLDSNGIHTVPRRFVRTTWNIPWNEIQGIGVVTQKGQGTTTSSALKETYFIVAADRMLVWSVSENATTMHNYSEAILSVIVQQTGLPIREVGPNILLLCERRFRAMTCWERLGLGQPLNPSMRTFIAHHVPTFWQSGPLRRSLVRNVSTCLLPVLLLIIGGDIAMRARDMDLRGLPDRVHSMTPIYSADLMALPDSWQFVRQGEGVKATTAGLALGSQVVLRTPVTGHDFAIEWTYAFGTNLVLRATEDFSRSLLVTLDAFGWEIGQSCYPPGPNTYWPNYLTNARCSDLYKPLWRANFGAYQLNQNIMVHSAMIIASGDRYVLFVDGQYLGGYTAIPGVFPTSGFMGFAAKYGGETIRDLRVYRLRPAHFWAVI